MIEQAMIFVLGVCTAGLLALLCLPAISRRAMRLSQAAVERQMPISVDEIVAQRDLLRAEFATERRRVEQALEAANAAHAAQMSESGQRAVEIHRLGTELATVSAARAIAEQAATVAERLANETGGENAALQKALYDLDGAHARVRDQHDALTGRHTALSVAQAESEAAVASLQASETETAHVLAGLDRDLAQARLDLSIARAREEALAAQVDGHEETMRTARATQDSLRATIADYERGGGTAGDLDMLRRTIVEIGREVVRMAEAQGTPAAGVEPLPSVAVN